MRSKFITDPQDSFAGFPDPAGYELYTAFFPHDGSLCGADLVRFPYAPALVSEAVASSGAQGTPGSTLSMTAGGITFNLLFDAAAMAAPQSFRDGIQQAATLLTTAISDKITVNIKIDFSGTGGGAAAGPDNGLYESYSSVRADLINSATAGDTTFNALPSGSSIQGQTNVAVWNAELKLWGILGANDTTTDDGSATFATDISSGLLVGVALHEITHAMGRVPYGPAPDIFDLFRFTSPGARMFDGGNTASAAYFSVDGGSTKLADFGQSSDPSDFLNSGVQGAADPFNEYYGGGTIQGLTTPDKQQLDALGFHMATVAPSKPDLTAAFDHVSNTTIAAGGSTSVDFWLVNFGKAAAAASTSGLYLSTDATITTADTLLTTVASPGLTANGTAGYYDHQTVSLTLPGNLAPGTYYIGGVADSNNTIAESNETNNNHDATQITVTGPAQPDLTAAFDHVSNTTIAAGGSTSVDFWLVNFGKAAAAASTSGFYFSTDATITTADTLLTTVASPGLTANGTAGYYDHQTVSLALPSNLAPGTYYIGGIADYNNVIAESNEANNNHDVTKITVTAPSSSVATQDLVQHHLNDYFIV
jgi:CARDB